MDANKHSNTIRLGGLLAVAILLIGAAGATAGTNIRDIARLQGARENKIHAVGMVVGLNGTGDGNKNVQALRSMVKMLQLFGSDVQSLSDINAANVALVQVTVTIPENGARQGQKLDAQIASINGAKSLSGGRLILTPLLGPTLQTTTIYGLAEGVVSMPNETDTRVGVIKGGAILEEDILPQYVDRGRIIIALSPSHAEFSIAATLAKVINEAEANNLATAKDAGSIIVRVPVRELLDPADFISRVMGLPVLMPDRQARIYINERTETIVITGDVEIDPVLISSGDLTVSTFEPPARATVENPQVTVRNFVSFDSAGAGSARLKDLETAFNQLQVPVKERIDIIRALASAGVLHARIIEE